MPDAGFACRAQCLPPFCVLCSTGLARVMTPRGGRSLLPWPSPLSMPPGCHSPSHIRAEEVANLEFAYVAHLPRTLGSSFSLSSCRYPCLLRSIASIRSSRGHILPEEARCRSSQPLGESPSDQESCHLSPSRSYNSCRASNGKTNSAAPSVRNRMKRPVQRDDGQCRRRTAARVSRWLWRNAVGHEIPKVYANFSMLGRSAAPDAPPRFLNAPLHGARLTRNSFLPAQMACARITQHLTVFSTVRYVSGADSETTVRYSYRTAARTTSPTPASSKRKQLDGVHCYPPG